MRTEAPSTVSRSVGRLIDILEAFEEHRQPLTSGQICEVLDSPRSSVAALLRILVEKQILSLDRRRNTYFPTARLARLGSWHRDELLITPKLRQNVRILRDMLEETIAVAMPVDLQAEVLHFEQGIRPLTLQLQPGALFPLWGTAIGSAYLSTLPMSTARSMLARAQKLGAPFAPPETYDLTTHVSLARRQGFAVADGAVETNLKAVAMPMRFNALDKPLVISVGGPSERISGMVPYIVSKLREVCSVDHWK